MLVGELCPKCKEVPEVVLAEHDRKYHVACRKCNLESKFPDEDPDEALANWNILVGGYKELVFNASMVKEVGWRKSEYSREMVNKFTYRLPTRELVGIDVGIPEDKWKEMFVEQYREEAVWAIKSKIEERGYTIVKLKDKRFLSMEPSQWDDLIMKKLIEDMRREGFKWEV